VRKFSRGMHGAGQDCQDLLGTAKIHFLKSTIYIHLSLTHRMASTDHCSVKENTM
jgi:hypothetical protein